MRFNSIRSKIIFYSSLCLLFSSVAIITFATLSVRNTAIRKASIQISFVAQDSANHVQLELNRAITSIKTLATILKSVKNSLNPISLGREEIDSLLQTTLKTNKLIVGAYTCWPLNGFDNNDKMYINEPGHDETGRFAPYWYQNKNGIFEVEMLHHEEINGTRDFKHTHSNIHKLLISDPYIRNIGGKDISVISLIMPVNMKKKYQGYVGIDICCHSMNYLTRNADIEAKKGQIIIINNDRKILGITGRPDLLCKNIAEIPDAFEIDTKKMAGLNPFEISSQDKIYFFAPVILENTKHLWVIVSLPRDQVTLDAAILSKKLIFTGIACIIVSILFLWFFSAHIVRSLGLLIKSTELIGQGNYKVPLEKIKTHDEIGKLASTLSIMSNEIGKNEFEKNKIIKELHKAEGKYRSMMESMADPVTICSSDYRIEYMNPAMIKRTGHDATGEKCFKIIHDLDEKCSWCMAYKTQQGESFNTDIVSPKDNRSFHISHSPVVNKDNSVSKMTVFRDTTDFKNLESQLYQVQKMESIGTLAGGIAHDFNNILFPIIGHSEMLLQDIPEDSPFKKGLSQIYTAALRASELVKQILTFSRKENSEFTLMKMQPVIKEALKLIRSTIPATIEIKQNIQPDCGVIKADPTQIHQIVMNLATNAYHAMEESGGVLKISVQEIELSDYDVVTPDMIPGVYACLTISDTGKGMDKDLTQKIFEPFFTTKEAGKGTGMGLSVVYGIVKKMNGAVHVYSEPGKGTKFNVYLPLADAVKKQQATNVEVSIKGGTEHILLVDDEKVIIIDFHGK